jgi:hypothetical protein
MHFDALERLTRWVWTAAGLVAGVAALVFVWPASAPKAGQTAEGVCLEGGSVGTDGVLGLQAGCPQLQLPDLSSHLVYYGGNGRPDAPRGSGVQVGLKESQEIVTGRIGERLYLALNSSGQSVSYSWSQGPTSLWIEPIRADEQLAMVRVALEDEAGNRVATPMERAQLELTADAARAGGSWMVGPHKVDNGLLQRQKARWIGRDLFLEMHGGEQGLQGKQRIDFESGGTGSYSCFVAAGDMLVWRDGKWQAALPPDTVGYPLLVLRKVEDRMLQFELWDRSGTSSTEMSLALTPASSSYRGQINLRLVGIDTWTRFMVEMDSKRTVLHVNDWLLRTGNSWKKLTTAQEIDAYVQGKVAGDLLVLDQIEKRPQGTFLKAHLFGANRTTVEQVELPLQGAQPTAQRAGEPDLDSMSRRLEQLSEGRGP